MKRMYEFECPDGHITESYVEETTKTIGCSFCDYLADRIISKPRIVLDGVSMDFPSAADRWARVHEEAAVIARKRKYG